MEYTVSVDAGAVSRYALIYTDCCFGNVVASPSAYTAPEDANSIQNATIKHTNFFQFFFMRFLLFISLFFAIPA